MTKEELKNLVSKSESILSRINAIKSDTENSASGDARDVYNKLYPLLKEFNDGAENLLSGSDVLQIGVVGQVKAGKSSFLNSLFFDGESILPKASTPMTAGLTVLEYADTNSFVVEYFTKKDWDIFVEKHKAYLEIESEVRSHKDFAGAPESRIRSEINKRCGEEVLSAYEMVEAAGDAEQKIGSPDEVQHFFNNSDLQDVLEKYVGAKGKYTSVVKSLYIKLNDERLKGYRIVDTPGVNDPVVSREERTKEFLRSCHCVMLLSSSSDFLGSADVSFLNSRVASQGIKCVLLLASKFDSVLQDRGADCAMKRLPAEDLVEAKDDQISKCKRRLSSQRDSIKGELNIRIDFTSGIGYSIAHKDKAKWDEVEKNVVNQMKRFYPEYFLTDEDIKETFNALSNVDDIKGKYLEGWFLDNKDSIIKEKVEDYFTQNISSIKEAFAKEYKNLQVKFDVLQKTSAEEIEEQLEVQKNLFDKLESKLKNYIKKFNSELQADTKSIQNSANLILPYKVPTESTSSSITHKGDWFGHNTKTFTYERIDKNELEQTLTKTINSYLQEINEKWKTHFSKAKTAMYNEVVDAIFDAAKDIKSTAFNDDYFRGIVDDVLTNLETFRELEIRHLRNQLEAQVKKSCDIQFEPKGQYEVQYDSVYDELRRGLDQAIDNTKHRISALKFTVEEEVVQLIDSSMRDAIKVAENLEKTFVPKLNESCEKYMSDLREKLKQKEKVTKDSKALILEIENLNGLLN